MRIAIAFAAMCACTIPPEDYDAFNCPAPPASPPAIVTITGYISDALGGMKDPVPGVTVTPMPSGSAGTSGMNGDFTVTIATGGSPTFELSGGGIVPTLYVPGQAFYADAFIAPVTITPAELAMLGSASGLPIGSDSETIFVTVVDCRDANVYGATLTSSSGEVLLFGSDQRPDGSLTTTTAPLGAGVVIGATGSDVVIATTYETYRQNYAVHATPGMLTEAEILPQPSQ